MSTLVVQKKIRICTIGTWDWKKQDYQTPLVFPFSGAKTFFYLDTYDPGKRQREIMWHALFQVHFSPPPAKILQGLKTRGKNSLETAELIYNYYRETAEKFEALIRTSAQIKYLMPDENPMSIEGFFSRDSFYGNGVTWFIDNNKPIPFEPKIAETSRRIAPLFRRNQLIDKKKWKKIQGAINQSDFPSEEMIELLRIRSRLEWRRKKVATIEAAVFAETLLREYTNQTLVVSGISKNKLKSLRDGLSFNIMLNAVLPLSLSRSECCKIQKNIEAVDTLRKIRNDIVHGNIKEEDIDEERVRNGIEATLKIVNLIKSKLKK